MIPTASQMLLGLYETLSAHHKLMYATDSATRALVQTLCEDPAFHRRYELNHLACIAQTSKKEAETQALIDGALRLLRDNMKES